jgi:hypothetical protein
MNHLAPRHFMKRPRSCLSLFILAAAAASGPAFAIEHGSTASDLRYASGGIGLSERNAMYAERGQYRLWVATVARGSGAYLSNAHVTVRPAGGGEPVLDCTMEGPWLFIDLPPGRYAVTAELPAEGGRTGATVDAQTHVEKSGLSQVVLRFPVRTEVSPERDRPFGGNPFGATAKR